MVDLLTSTDVAPVFGPGVLQFNLAEYVILTCREGGVGFRVTPPGTSSLLYLTLRYPDLAESNFSRIV